MSSRCQKCSKSATYHITDIERGKPREYHLCDEHARQLLTPAEEPPSLSISELAAGMVKGGGAASGDPSPADRLTCPLCQISFLEFRNSGRLGCPHDYKVFHDELMPLLENIHEVVEHSGKSPRRAPATSQVQTELIDLRNQLKRAVAAEDYEEAARIRDSIRTLEQAKSGRGH